MTNKTLKYNLVNIDLLIPYVNNAKKHSDKQITKVASSIREFGFLNPVIIDKNNGIIAGHCRLQAAKKLGLTEIPCLQAEHLSEAQKKAYILADNKLAEMAEWDEELLKIELEELKELDFDLDIIGFGLDDLPVLDDEDEGKPGEDIYTKKIEAPIYTPKGIKPKISELFNTGKTKELINNINNSSIPQEEKDFLVQAAQRHTVFNYENIAEYYAHAPKEVQELMEQSALVIIDFNKAIELGFVQMTKDLAEAYQHDPE